VRRENQMGLFKRKGREMADAAREATPGAEPKHKEGDPGLAGYDSIRYDPKVKHPVKRFNFVRPDGKPPLKKGEESRKRGFFS
jgi:hypothetical protein